ncbi:TPA: hypothetical protein ACGOWO_002370, partial [Streptococcus suis]
KKVPESIGLWSLFNILCYWAVTIHNSGFLTLLCHYLVYLKNDPKLDETLERFFYLLFYVNILNP